MSLFGQILLHLPSPRLLFFRSITLQSHWLKSRTFAKWATIKYNELLRSEGPSSPLLRLSKSSTDYYNWKTIQNNDCVRKVPTFCLSLGNLKDLSKSYIKLEGQYNWRSRTSQMINWLHQPEDVSGHAIQPGTCRTGGISSGNKTEMLDVMIMGQPRATRQVHNFQSGRCLLAKVRHSQRDAFSASSSFRFILIRCRCSPPHERWTNIPTGAIVYRN